MKKLLFAALALCGTVTIAQQNNTDVDLGRISGNFQTDVQYYFRDTLIDPTGDAYPDEHLLGSGFLNLTYTRGNFIAGVRYENYQNNRIGLPVEYKGEGITYRYARFIKNKVDITAGNFYEQFGSGLALRAYEERGLGIDNNIDGLRVIFTPIEGITLKGIIGRQRLYFDKSPGILRGFDGEWNLKQTLHWQKNQNLILGGSFVSKFEDANNSDYVIPKNVATSAVRLNYINSAFNLYAEYAHKINDPNRENGYIYKDGNALYFTGSFAKNNLGISLGYKYYDNMLWRSYRDGKDAEALVNYMPAVAELHTYSLPALYSFNTQPNGETGFQTQVSYNFKRGTFLGGKYGTILTGNFSNSYSLKKDYDLRPVYNTDTVIIDSTIAGTNGYSSQFFAYGKYKYFQDLNFEVRKKLTKNLKMHLTYYNMVYNFDVLNEGVSDYILDTSNVKQNIVYLNAGVLELLYKLKSRQSIRTEMQLLLTKQDRGDWALLLVEYSIAPTWSFAVQDAYNYGNPDPDLQIHYLNLNLGYTVGTTKFQLGYGRQQKGVFCVGGICRTVPASSGITLSITSNF